MAFEQFTSDKAIPRGEPMATITSYGRMALNKSATYRLAKDKVSTVLLFFDKDTNRVGIKPSEKMKGSFSLSIGANGNGSGISCIPFLMYIEYDWTATRNFSASWDEDEQMYVFEIPEQNLGKTVTGEHNKKKV